MGQRLADDYIPNDAVIYLAYKSAEMAKKSYDNDAMIINRIQCLVAARHSRHFDIFGAIWSAENQMAQVNGDGARIVCMDLLKTLRSRKS